MAYESIANYDYWVIFPYNDWNPPIDIPCLNNE